MSLLFFVCRREGGARRRACRRPAAGVGRATAAPARRLGAVYQGAPPPPAPPTAKGCGGTELWEKKLITLSDQWNPSATNEGMFLKGSLGIKRLMPFVSDKGRKRSISLIEILPALTESATKVLYWTKRFILLACKALRSVSTEETLALRLLFSMLKDVN